MSEPKRIQIVRSHQNINEYVYQRDQNIPDSTYEQLLVNQQDYHAIGWRRLRTCQSLSLKENWPITIGNAAASFSSGFLG